MPRPAPDDRLLGGDVRAGRGGSDQSPGNAGSRFSFDVFGVSQRLGAYLDLALEWTGIRPAEYAVYSLIQGGRAEDALRTGGDARVPPSRVSGIVVLITAWDGERAPGNDRLALVPDVAVEVTWDDYAAVRDPVLKAALGN